MDQREPGWGSIVGAGTFTVGCGELFDVLTKEARSLFLEVPLHGRRAHVTGFEAS